MRKIGRPVPLKLIVIGICAFERFGFRRCWLDDIECKIRNLAIIEIRGNLPAGILYHEESGRKVIEFRQVFVRDFDEVLFVWADLKSAKIMERR